MPTTSEGCATDLAELNASCEAVRKSGGVKKRVWIGRLADINATISNGYVTAITLNSASPQNYLYKFIGRALKHSGTIEGVVGENFNSLTQNVLLQLYYFFPDEKAAIEKLWNAEDVVCFLELEAKDQNGQGQIEVWGLDVGLKGSALTGGTGILKQDSTALTVTLSGDQDTLPKTFRAGGSPTLQDSIDYLNNLTENP
jgi:hypothetical protein